MGKSSSKLKETIETLSARSDLDEKGKKSLNLLRKNGKSIMKEAPEVLVQMVRKAHVLIGSPFYSEIIQKMVEKYQEIGRGSLEGPLQCLVEQMEDSRKKRALFEHQEKLLSLIQILQKAYDSSQTRTKCLNALLLSAQYGPRETEGRLQWREDLTDTMGLLIEEGADPTWVPQDDDEGSALYNFLQRIPLILAHDAHLYNALLSLLLRFLTEQCLNHREPRGTVLHALVDCDWNKLPEDLPAEFSEQYKGIISTAVEANPALLDMTDSHGRNPLQHFMSEITKHKDLLRIVNDIVPTLKTENNVNAQDEGGQTVLHILAGQCSQIGHEAFLELVKCLRSSSSVDIQDKDGQTILHILARKCSHIGHEAFHELVKCLRSSSNVDIQDKDGQAVLHILARQCSQIGHKAFLELVKCLRSSSSVNIQDKDGQTILHILAGKCSHIGHEAFHELVKCLRSSSNVDIQDQHGHTVLHILARAALENQELGGGLLTIFSLLTTERNVNLCDNDLVPPFSWILAAKTRWGNSERERNIFSEMEEIFLCKGADANLAKGPAFRKPLYRWARQELSDEGCTSDRLEMLLGGLQILPSLPDGNTLSYMREFQREVWWNLWRMRHAKCIPTLMAILMILTLDESSAQHVWTSMMKYPIEYPNFYIITLSVMDLLCLCAERGAQPTGKELQEILGRTSAMTMNEELTVSFLKTLVALHRKKHFICHLQFLGDFYLVSQEMLQLGRKLVCAVYETMDNCLKSRKLIDCLLFISHKPGKPLDEKFIENSFEENWLHRSPLHLMVMLLYNENSLKCIPPNIVTKYLKTPDIHGCMPLHLAHLHHNKQAVHYLTAYGAKQDVTDNFGMIPKSLESPDTTENHPDVKYKELCHSVLEAKCGMRPMLVHSEVAAKALSDEVKTLFERLVRGTQFETAFVDLTGSIREKMKAGRLDEVDVLLKFKYEVENDELLDCLRKRLAKISWEGIDLRPISIHGPWKFLREGVTVALDVVAVIVYEGEILKEDRRFGYITQKEAHGLQGELLGGKRPLHKRMKYCPLEMCKGFKETYSAYEWDMTDSLPASCRLAIVIAKALVQAYDLCRGDRLRVKMPITSYMIKTALFYILADNSSQLMFKKSDIFESAPAEALINALDHVKGNKNEVKTRAKLEYNPQPKWLTDEDVDQHGEEARVLGRKVFTLIKFLTQQRNYTPQGWQLSSYWHRENPVTPVWNFSEAECICDVCDCALECLNHVTL